MKLRDFQADMVNRFNEAWSAGARDVLGVAACGAGKSVIAAHVIHAESAASVFIAHRSELISGESLALARNGVRHRVIGQPALRRECSRRHISEGLYDHIDPNARVAIASVDTLIGLPAHDPWVQSVRMVVTDEAHHLLRSNKWGRALEMFPNARGLGLTATPLRADGKGLGRHADGVFDILIEGPTAREIELMGFLTPHKIYAPPSDLDLSTVTVSASGDYSPKLLVAATRKSHIVGDVVQHYLRLAPGKLGMTFAVDVASAGEIAQAFRDAGIAAEVVTGNTPADVRNAIFRRFRAGDVQQLVSCEIAGEGFDLPDVAVISLARATESYALATQQIGRVKRILAGKDCGIVIDHVGNTQRHCTAKQCPSTGEWYVSVGEREWSLDRRERRSSSKTPQIALTTCPSCLQVYERVLGRTCPYCKNTTEPTGRSAPEMVDGELAELDPQALAQLQGEVARVDGVPVIPFGATPAIQGAVMKRHRERQEAQHALREVMAVYGGWRVAAGADIGRAQREWYHEFGTDVMSAQALGRAEADVLRARVEARLRAAGIAIDKAVS